MTQFVLTLRKMDTSPNTHLRIVNETINLHVKIDDKEIELLIIASLI